VVVELVVQQLEHLLMAVLAVVLVDFYKAS
jgi:hypothetical protein